MKLTPQEKRIVEICRGKLPVQTYHRSPFGASEIVRLVARLSHSLEARAKRKGRVKAVRGWVGHDHHGFGRELYRASDEDLRVRWLGKARAILTISLPRKVRGKS